MANWTPEAIEELKKLTESGASRLRIAAKLGRKISAVVAKAKVHGIRLKTTGEIRKSKGLAPTWNLHRDY